VLGGALDARGAALERDGEILDAYVAEVLDEQRT